MKLEVDYSKNKMDRLNDHIDDNNFRRGWEACLEALLKRGYPIRQKGDTYFHGTDTQGTLVFIPYE